MKTIGKHRFRAIAIACFCTGVLLASINYISAARVSITGGSSCTLSENFDDITTLTGAGWFMQNNSQPLGKTNWFQGNTFVFVAQSGAANAYIGANFNNTGTVGTISNWLLTPPVVLQNGTTLAFFTRTATASSFADRLQVRMSLNGASTNVGTAPTDVGDFTALLLDINPSYTTSGYPDVWTQFTVVVSGAPTPVTGRLAFHYFVENGGTNGTNSNYVGIDTLCLTSTASPLRISSATRGSDGHFFLTGTSSPNALVRIQATTDLASQFVTIDSVTANPAGVFQYEDKGAGSFSKRFYRATYP